MKLPHPSYAVIARLVLLDGAEEWRPARAVRWNPTHVMVKLQDKGVEPEYVWLRCKDVQRVSCRPPLLLLRLGPHSTAGPSSAADQRSMGA